MSSAKEEAKVAYKEESAKAELWIKKIRIALQVGTVTSREAIVEILRQFSERIRAEEGKEAIKDGPPLINDKFAGG